MIDIPAYYDKLARKLALTEGEIVELLKELEHFRVASAYLASCEAATLESLPKAFSKSGRERHVSICRTAAALLQGDGTLVRFPTDLGSARDRCLRVIDKLRKA